MQITIETLTLDNFKGIRNITLELGGKSADVYGRNGTGKTSLFDAFTWLLFGKDSENREKFDYKPLDRNGQPVTGADTSVEAVLNVDGKHVKLRRCRHERWKAAPGNPNPVYQGDETLCWIDDVPVKLEKDYQPYIASLIGDEEQFKVLSIHGYFMRKHWKDRRNMLVAAAGDDPQAEIIRRPQFVELPGILGGHSPDDARKRLMDQKKRVAAELDAIPVRLDEIQRSIEVVTEQEVEDAQTAIRTMNTQIDLINSQLAGTEEGFAHARALIAKEREITVKLDARRKALDEPNEKKRKALQDKIAEAGLRKSSMDREIRSLEGDIASVEKDITSLQQRREQLLVSWDMRNDELFKPGPVTTVCRLCGQPLPAEQIAQAKQREYAVWAEKKDNDLASIEEQGKSIADRIVRCQNERDNVAESLERKRQAADAAESEMQRLMDEAEQPMEAPDYESDPEYAVLLADLQKIRDEIAKPDGSAAMREELTRQRDALIHKIGEADTVNARRKQYQLRLDRIRELEDQRAKLGQDAIRIDGELALLAEFIHTCCDAMEESINAMFHTIRWHLTDYQKDGTPVDCCVPYVDGVSYDSTLNNGAMINAGIEAIRVLSHAAGIAVPCFVDNAEAVNDLAYTGGQMIRLRVSNDTKLTMTLED